MELNLDNIFNTDKNEPPVVMKVRIKTSYYQRGHRYCKETQITDLSKKQGYSISDEISQVGVEQVLTRVVNLDEVEDGDYEVIFINAYRDWETGCIEDWDYKLVKLD